MRSCTHFKIDNISCIPMRDKIIGHTSSAEYF